MANEYVERCSISLISREMQNRTTRKYHLTPTRMSVTKKSKDNKGWWGCGGKRTLVTVGGNVDWHSYCRKQYIGIEILYDSKIPLLGIYPQDMKSQHHENICTAMFIIVLFTVAEIWKQSLCTSTDEWIKKLWHIYAMKCNSTPEKNWILSFTTTWISAEHPMLIKRCQTQEK